MSVRTVHTSFTSTDHTMRPSSYYPPGLGLSLPSAMNSSPSLVHSELPSPRRRSGSFDAGHNVLGFGVGVGVGIKQNHQPPVQRRRTSLSRLPYASSHFRASEFKFDPFASDDAPSQAWQHTPPLKNSQKSPPASHFTISLPNLSTRSLPSIIKSQPIVPIATPPKPDKNARARIVAGILLNRIYAVGKPMRRRMASSLPSKTYVPSGLSSVVTVEC